MSLNINSFIDCYTGEFTTKYKAGFVCKDEGGYFIGYEMVGAAETFSVGQPIYDGDRNLMGYLGVSLYEHLNYSADIRIPVERWSICLPTKYCVKGKAVYTYWQTVKGGEQ